jgi:hypothetical protein
MFEENITNSLLTKSESEKNILISFSLFLRLLEWSKDESKSDVDLHKVMEKLISFNDGVNPLTIDCYDCLVADVPHEHFDGEECQCGAECGGNAPEEVTQGYLQYQSGPVNSTCFNSIDLSNLLNTTVGAEPQTIEISTVYGDEECPDECGCPHEHHHGEGCDHHHGEGCEHHHEGPCCGGEECQCAIAPDMEDEIKKIIATGRF